jgi:hypothetical protein
LLAKQQTEVLASGCSDTAIEQPAAGDKRNFRIGIPFELNRIETGTVQHRLGWATKFTQDPGDTQQGSDPYPAIGFQGLAHDCWSLLFCAVFHGPSLQLLLSEIVNDASQYDNAQTVVICLNIRLRGLVSLRIR